MLETFATGHIKKISILHLQQTINQSIHQSKMGTTTLQTLKQTGGIKQ